MTADGHTDEQLLAAHVRGDAGALDTLLIRYLARVRQFVAWKAGVRGAEADDLAQEVFLQVLRSADRFRGQSRFRTWLYGVANHVCRHWVRSTSRRQRVLVEGTGEDSGSAELPQVDERPDALDRLQREERARSVRDAVAGLSSDHKQVLLLADWEDMSYPEIAEALAIPVGTVKSRVHHARLQLAGALAELR